MKTAAQEQDEEEEASFVVSELTPSLSRRLTQSNDDLGPDGDIITLKPKKAKVSPNGSNEHVTHPSLPIVIKN